MRSLIVPVVGTVAVVAAGAWVTCLGPRADPAGNEAGEVQDAIPIGYVSGEQLREYRELDARQQETLARVAVKREAAADLVRGSITLDEAAARFRDVNLACPHLLELLRTTHPGVPDDELHYVNVIGFVRGTLGSQTGASSPLVARLEEQFRARFPGTPPAGAQRISAEARTVGQ